RHTIFSRDWSSDVCSSDLELRVDEWGIDAIYSGSQKCLSCVPGLSPVSFSPAAVEKLKNRKTPVQSWFLDQSLVMAYWTSAGGKIGRASGMETVSTYAIAS